MKDNETPDNVVKFPKQTSIFSDNQKARLITKISDISPMPDLVVEKIEQDLCVQAIEEVRSFADRVSKSISSKLADLIFGR